MLLPSKARRFATGGQLGYESQLGNGLGTSTGAAAVGDALYKNLPPLALPYIPVKQAAAVDTTAAVAQADADGLKQAEKMKDEYMKMYDGATKDARMTAAHRGELARRWDGLMSGLYQDVSKNPAYFGSQSNRLAFQQKALKALDQGDLASYQNQYDALNDKEKRVAEAKQQSFKAYINGRRTDYTNQQVFDAARSEGNLDRLGQITGVTAARNGNGNLDFSQLNIGVKTGNEHDALEEFKGHYLELPTSTRGSSGEGYGVKTIGSLGQEHIVTSGGGSTRTSNQAKVNALAAKISSGPEGWRSIGLSEAAQYGLYEPKAAKWDDTALQNPLVITSAQGKAKTLAAGSMSRGEAIQAALEAGDQATYKQLATLRDQTVGHEISNQLRTQLGLKAVDSLETKQTVSVGARTDTPDPADKTKDSDNVADIAFGGPGFNTSSDHVDVTDVNGKKVAVPIQVKNIGANPELMKLANFLVKTEDLDAAGKPVERYKNLSELSAHTIYAGSGMHTLQGGATTLSNPEKFVLRGVMGEVAFMPRNPDAKGEYKQSIAQFSAASKQLQTLNDSGKLTEKEYNARMGALRKRASNQGFQAFVKVKLGASEEAWKANEGALGNREVKENGKLVSKKPSDYQGFLYNSNDQEAMMQQQWNLKPISNTEAMEAQGAFSNQGWFGKERVGKNAYETEAWLSWDNLHTNGEKKNLRTNATLNEQELQDKQAQTQGMFTAPPFK